MGTKLIQLLGAVALLPLSLHAQTTSTPLPVGDPATTSPGDPAPEIANPEPAAAAPAAQAAPTPSAGPAPASAQAQGSGTAAKPVTELASRNVGPDPTAYIESMVAVLAIQSRAYDPFGLPEDLTVKKEAPKVIKKAGPGPSVAPATPYSDIIGQIGITTLISSEKRFLVGVRSFSVGDRFPIQYNGRDYPSEIVDVAGSSITFKNSTTGEIGVKQFSILPAGVMRSGGGMAPPGMHVPKPTDPLQIDANPRQGSSGSPLGRDPGDDPSR